jgi:hypothetical protein
MIFQWRLLLSTNENAVQRRKICCQRFVVKDLLSKLVVRKLRKNPNCGREPSAGLDLLEWLPRDLKQAYRDFKRGLLAMDPCTTIS